MSHFLRVAVVRFTPRWSRLLTGALLQEAGAAAPIAGDPDCSLRVAVGPPLAARTPRCGSMGAAVVPTRVPLTPLVSPGQPVPVTPVFWPIRLWPPSMTLLWFESQSTPCGAVLPASRVLTRVT